MADLIGGGGPSSVANSNSSHASRRPTAGPAPTSSPSGIRGPRMIMQERAAREARQKAEAEQQQMERARAEQEARITTESQRRNTDRRPAGVAPTQGTSLNTTQIPTDPNSPAQRHAGNIPSSRNPAPISNQLKTHEERPSSRHRPTQSQSRPPAQQPAPQQQSYTAQAPTSAPQPGPTQHVATDGAAAEPSIRDSGSTKPRNSFPHAFERWETLSAHWEGLTSYWIRKLEQNKDDINRDPVSQQLARQVTDLSAAGANLFHAVVELQRLRASSERKFQRWFFETRSELERSQEVNGMLERALEQERRDRADAIRDALQNEQGTSKAQQQLTEMRKELAISKEEARRAWEELGRRENQERERTLSLQNGQPTIVGGVQVVPMVQGAPSRQASAREPQQEYTQGYGQPSQAPPVQPTTPPGSATAPESYYRSQEPAQHQSPQRGAQAQSDDGYSEGEYMMDAQGKFVYDIHGRKVPYAAAPSTYSGSDAGPEEYDTPATTNPPSGGPEAPTSSSAAGNAQWTGTYSEPAEYSGQGYQAPGWETVPRHHHPTRLSDVIEEEDERSRASTSHVGRERRI